MILVNSVREVRAVDANLAAGGLQGCTSNDRLHRQGAKDVRVQRLMPKLLPGGV
eukprot:CAMPEP_0171247684 /NCGR_PEP_ID=MMETSP0790-20130122/48622_1 /TAXON_ID=2925 /ORGANISM="Alexandrium catenella, Strain OF101" /LENGTH=53 /DNA_ID=CAMNT_0011715101 /DNA_START=17 /DNA_END=175 /DNA_ORIENTATION=+